MFMILNKRRQIVRYLWFSQQRKFMSMSSWLWRCIVLR